MLVVGGSNSKDLARAVARRSGLKYFSLLSKDFPDGEKFIRFIRDVKGEDIVLIETMHPPDESLIEILFAAHTAVELGAKSVTLVAPYLAYMRQDKRFHKGESISAKIVARMLSGALDRVVTIDPHLHRFHNLKEVYHTRVKRLSANTLIAEYIKNKIKSPLIIGPDGESAQWASKVAHQIGCESTVMTKTRYSGTRVKVHFKDNVDYTGKHIVIVDDIISTGHTMMENIKHLRKLGVKRITCIAVHGVFVEDAYKKLRKMNVDVVTSNTISHKSNKIDVSRIIAEEL